MRFDITYTTSFDYDAEVVESQDELRAAPATTPTQQLVHYAVRTTPSARVFSYRDYWGTRVDSFGVRPPHRRLTVVADATVETSSPRVMAGSPRFADLTPEFLDSRRDYLGRSHHTDWGDGVATLAATKRDEAGVDDLAGFVLGVHRMIGTTCEYRPGATWIGIEVEDVLARRHGVCQDFAHLMVALLRAGGVPARYVSGYLFASSDETGEAPEDDRVQVQTHAWVEVAMPGHGWWGLDPTNRQVAGERHIKIGHGRDVADVTPLRGVYVGEANHELHASVDMRRVSLEMQAMQSQQ